MIIKDLRDKGKPGYGEHLNVYGIYWFPGELYFYCSPSKYDGLMSYSETEVEIVDPVLGSDFVFRQPPSGSNSFVHKILLEDNLLEDLSEYDPVAYKKFVEKLGKEP